MGEYFFMSMRFNKETPEDFGLIQGKDNEIAINPNDHSLWKKCNLYDFGWGKENGFYKLPLPEFTELLEIVINTKYYEDKYGSASIILDLFPLQLLEESERLIFNSRDLKKLKEFIEVFNLLDPTNKSPTKGKLLADISRDYERWKFIAYYIQKAKIF